uniref:PR domain zinc finger protein 8 n=1 Tax=Hucho hucho TaxID=62062 RepID=A0A4W5LDK1_9TELE
MEESSSQKLVWDGDAKAVQQCLTDIFTSVYTTCDIPENAIFGPCVLSHTSLYDSIAFVALKSTDKRTAPYIFRVDTSAANSTSEGLMWLRLVQSARDRDEQNLEAYVKNGQLFYRSLRRIVKDEELLVWYGKDLIELLLLSAGKAPVKTKGSAPYSCPDCNQRFQFEFPFLAHLRFRCTKRLQSMGDSAKPSTDFHNLARDLENSRTSPPSDREAEIRSESSGKRKFSEVEDRDRERDRDGSRASLSLSQSLKSKEELASSTHGNSSSTKNLQSSNAENKDGGRPSPGSNPPQEKHLNTRVEASPLGSAFTSVAQHGGGNSGERKSAFSQPSRHSTSSFSHISPLVMTTPKLLDCHPAVGDTISSSRLYQADHLAAKLHGAELSTNCPVPGAMSKQSPFLYAAAAATAFWPKSQGPIQLQMPSALTLLPPSFTSLCLPAQNWCAKCNASFRMTSDLVYHMRSHHKKELAMEPMVKRRREEKLKCPICNESFRERHHLSRHMTSHN